MGQRDEVLALVRALPGLCDDCVAAQLASAPRQAVNAHGRALQQAGFVGRAPRPCVTCGAHKIVMFEADEAPEGSHGTRRRGAAPVLDGTAALAQVLRRADYPSVVHAVAEHTVFLHPDTVAQTGGSAVFPVVRAPLNAPRRRVVDLPDGRRAWADDNGPPTWAFLWAARRKKGPDVQFNHVWPSSDAPERYTALWNLCATPAFLAKTTDTDPDVKAALRFRAYELYGQAPGGEAAPGEPESYSSLRWAPSPEPASDLEAVYRAAMRAAPKNSATIAARELGWLFSGWEPDPGL